MKIESPGKLTLEHMFYAYRKAKYDCFIDRTIGSAPKFVEYERNLTDNLKNLMGKLNRNEFSEFKKETHSNFMIITKKLGIEEKKNSNSEESNDGKAEENNKGHFYISDLNTSFEQHIANKDKLTPEFRIIGDFSVDMHVISALWINLIGVRFDAALSENAYGSRLRRYRNKNQQDKSQPGEYQRDGMGSFYPYFSYYKKWRENGFKVIREELEKDNSVIVMSMDISSFYHRIDPSFMTNDLFLKDAKITLEDWEREFSANICELLNSWSIKVREKINGYSPIVGSGHRIMGGIPIGIAISRVLSNALLIHFDRIFKEQLTPLYYGRYADDIILVIKYPGNIYNSDQCLDHISKRICLAKEKYEEYFVKDEGKINVKFFTGCNSEIILQPGKMKSFLLKGKTGLHMLDNIEREIISVSSERKLMHSPAELQNMTATKVITASSKESDNIDSIRRADGVSIKRLGFGVLFRTVETIAQDLPPDSWANERKEFYSIGKKYLFTPISIFENTKFIPRFISLAISVRDWEEAIGLIRIINDSLNEVLKASENIEKMKLNGYEITYNADIFDSVKERINQQISESIARSVKYDLILKNSFQFPQKFKYDLSQIDKKLKISDNSVNEYFCIDFGYMPLQNTILIQNSGKIFDFSQNDDDLLKKYKYKELLKKFINKIIQSNANYQSANNKGAEKITDKSINYNSFLFPTRPLKPNDIFCLIQKIWETPHNLQIYNNKINFAKELSNYTKAIRGVWTKYLDEENGNASNSKNTDSELPSSNKTEGENIPIITSKPPIIEFPISNQNESQERQKIYLGISNFLTETKSFEASAKHNPDLSINRYERLKEIVNLAINAKPKPTHLLLPELSLPNEWLDTVSGRLLDQGISLIAGTEYNLLNENIYSAASLDLKTNILGYDANLRYRQIKSLPAPDEDHKLLRDFGKSWINSTQNHLIDVKPIFKHGDFTFGVLICSELQDMSNRLKFQGQVDCLIILSWNQDLNSFSVLVNSASLDVHAFVAIVNNRQYGDSRVRSPAKLEYKRELCQVKGGENNQLVVVEIDYMPLREFQSRAKNWPGEDDDFKPVPQGFLISPERKT